MSILDDQTDAVFTTLRERMERAKDFGEKAAALLNLNGSKTRLPDGTVSAFKQVMDGYAEVNRMAGNALAEQLKISRARPEPKPTPPPEEVS